MKRAITRLIVPDSHGAHADRKAVRALLRDAKRLRPDEVVLLGDHIDCGGTFSAHQRTYTVEMAESYEDDVVAATEFLDDLQRAAPSAAYHYLEGNHELHVERWASRTFFHKKDADMFVEKMGPWEVLGLKRRAVRYYRMVEQYMGIPVPGTIRLGKCYFTHGFSHSKNAAAVHLADTGANIVFGHVHRVQSLIRRNVTSEGMGAWCPGTLAKLQPLYRHSKPTEWTHGYAVQFVNPSGLFQHVNVSIVNGESMMAASGLLRAS